jgi:hypothetical protein
VPETDPASSILPIHIEETIQSIAGLNAERHANATHHRRCQPHHIAVGPGQLHRSADCFRRRLGEPELLRPRAWLSRADPPPFPWLAGASSLRAHEVSALAGKMEVFRQ